MVEVGTYDAIYRHVSLLQLLPVVPLPFLRTPQCGAKVLSCSSLMVA